MVAVKKADVDEASFAVMLRYKVAGEQHRGSFVCTGLSVSSRILH